MDPEQLFYCFKKVTKCIFVSAVQSSEISLAEKK